MRGKIEGKRGRTKPKVKPKENFHNLWNESGVSSLSFICKFKCVFIFDLLLFMLAIEKIGKNKIRQFLLAMSEHRMNINQREFFSLKIFGEINKSIYLHPWKYITHYIRGE